MYCTATDVRNALNPGGAGQAGGGTAASLDDTAINDAISEADGTIDTYLRTGTRYAVPTETAQQDPGTGPVTVTVAIKPVRFWSRNIAAYLATLTFRRGKDLPADDPVRLRYTDTMTLLTAIRDGKGEAPLPAPDSSSGGTSGEVFAANAYDQPLFGASDFGLVPHGFVTRRDVWPG